MTPRSLKFLGALFAGLLILWALDRGLRHGDRSPRLWADAASAVRLEIERGGENAVFIRHQDSWKIARPFAVDADSGRLDRLLSRLAAARLSKSLSRDRTRHELFGVSRSAGIRVRGWSEPGDSPAMDVWIGIPGAAQDSCFVRAEGKDDVMEARGLGRHIVDVPVESWADTVITAQDGTRVLWFDAGAGRVERGPESWSRAGVSVSSASVQALLTALARFPADEVMPADSAAFTPWKTVTVGLYGHDGKEAPQPLRIEIAALKKGRHLIRCSDRPDLRYSAAPWRLSPFRPFF